MRGLLRLCAIMSILMGAGWVLGQATPGSPLNVDNFRSLRSVRHVDFVTFGELSSFIETGWFTMSPDGLLIGLVRRDGGMIIIDTEGRMVDTYTRLGENGQPGTVLDAAFGMDSRTLAALHTDGEAYFITVRTIPDAADTATQANALTVVPFEQDGDMPVRVWLEESLEAVWLEVAAGNPAEPYYVIRLPLEPGEDDDAQPVRLPSGPQNDRESFVRIGRIPAPLAVTSTPQGLVKLWNLETGEVTAQVQLEAMPVFGRVDETTGRYLAWRDPNSETLNLLDFETGDNRQVAALDGEYIQAILLPPTADVIVGVAIGDLPIVAVWDVQTGERTDLGDYRMCSRVPDMIALSRDGRSLVIGCDTGLDIWQVSP